MENIKFENTKKGRCVFFEEHLIHLLSDYFDISLVSSQHYRLVSRVNDKRVDYFPKSEKRQLYTSWGNIFLAVLK